MKFDQEILFEFLPEEDKKYFMAWDNVFCNPNGLDAKAAGSARIVAVYRAPFEERILIPFEEYQMKLKQKERDNKLNTIL
jgi:hypothetical protein